VRCYCCNNILKPSESTRRFKETEFSPGDYTDMCDQCIKEITGVETVDGEGKDEELFDDDGNPIEDE
jgi:hypothetical protein